ncbi:MULTISPECIES: lytic transglycosylase domain-containing protein [Streptomyces]|uniref:Lytic transglycosylase domain-containing protein n=1 Tax=Streptomyces koelreuteriae TaxID=2838015 RepID=A0ABX8FZB5_9ACTN|nr:MULTISPECIES: lytic murein transglycosylase [Streptomyces]QWB26280.1 lytic transglycosylase domain-containing protein [Streptomyces koelreuteriae]UUA09358.1 lytic transglycosylase domain-containing protein [Streptomyces koelreuteriae]UUA16962.1 lytic transglycosylase domain-containing protein [Streptomyces sp. CRCS-T-1]
MAAQFGRRLRKGAATTAVAAVAVAALSASQAPGVNDHGRQTAADATPSPDASASESSATGNSPYYTDLPPLKSPNPSPSTGTGPVTPGTSEAGIPATVLDAYKKAETALNEAKPGCNLPWQLLAAIGKVESGQARGGRVDADGTTTSPILGPQLDGNGFALIRDTDDGAYDGNSSYDQAVGPMQFIPSTWQWAGRDGNADGKKDPNNIYDAALAAGHYLCRFDWDLSDQDDLDRAILSYNNSREYLNLVMRWVEYYRKGTHEIPDGTGTLPDNRSDDGAGTSPSPSTPSTPTTPSNPTTPAPGNSKPKPDPRPSPPEKPGGGATTPKPPTDPGGTPTPPPSTPPTNTDTVDHLEDAGTAKLTAMAGDAFTKRISTRAETKAGKAVAKVRVRFTIIGSTDTTFTGGENVATVATNSSGVAVAPALQAGEKTGEVTVRATVVGRTVAGLDYKATVTERAADALARTGDAALTCAPGGEFANQVEVKATYKGAVADGVAATATLIKSADDPTATDKGPYFKDADGKAVRTLKALKTDSKGLLKLPKLYADDTTGTFLLRINTAGGATLTVELTVAAAETSSPSPSTSPDA